MASKEFTTNTEQLFADGSQDLQFESQENPIHDTSQDLFSDDGELLCFNCWHLY
jgi:hypothetical protein